jgi:hypothetical protein
LPTPGEPTTITLNRCSIFSPLAILTAHRQQ